MILIRFSLMNTDIEHLDVLTGHSDVFCNELMKSSTIFIRSIVFIDFQRHLKYYGCRSLSDILQIFPFSLLHFHLLVFLTVEVQFFYCFSFYV